MPNPRMVNIVDDSGNEAISLNGDSGSIQATNIVLETASTMSLDAQTVRATEVRVENKEHEITVKLDGDQGFARAAILISNDLRIARKGANRAFVRCFKDQMWVTDTLHIRSQAKRTMFFGGSSGNVWLGGHGKDGSLFLLPSSVENDGDGTDKSDAKVHIDGEHGNLRLGDRFQFMASSGNLWVGGDGQDGDVFLLPESAQNQGDNTNRSEATIHLDAQSGDIKLANADCAELFTISSHEDVPAGSVVVVHDDLSARVCDEAYDRRALGVVSGAGRYKPGIILDCKRTGGNQRPVALAGKFYCLVDASYGAIELGDLLTTSETPGHAMVACDPARSFGAVIGKALAAHSDGTGLIPILVALQ